MKKLSFSKIFCFLSFLFILSCCIFYGTRFMKLYFENKKTEKKEANSIVKIIRENNEENSDYKDVNGIHYFTGKTDKNYMLYMNILWRIIKVNDDNSLTIISDKALTYLPYGKVKDYKESYISNWLNKSDTEYSGIFENLINKDYLSYTETCADKLDEPTNKPCINPSTDKYSTILSIADFLNIGSKDSYLINDEYFYLANMTTEDKAWYVDSGGNIKYNSGEDLLGIRPVLTIKSNADYVTGNGTKDNPYVVDTNTTFGSYVKLGNDTWRVYDINGSELRLALNNYLKVNDNNLTHRYSYNSSYHNDTASGSVAYYLNNTYLNSLSYKDKIKETKWSNGYINNSSLDYVNSLKPTVDTKVGMPSIGNVFLNSSLSNYYTMTGNKEKGGMVYVINADKRIFAKQISTELYIVPAITIDKSLLTKGNGTIDSPFEME